MPSGSRVAVLVHSSGLGPAMWRGYPPLAPDVRFVTPAMSGYDEALPPTESAAVDLELVADALARAEEPVHLVGHSYGGFVAATVALAHPDRVASLALLEPVMFGALRRSGDPEGVADLDSLDDPSWNDPELAGTPAWLETFVDYWNGPGAWRAMTPSQQSPFIAVGPKIAKEVHAVTHDPLPFERYRFPAPLLLLRGALTTVGAKRVVDHLARVNAHAHVVDLPGAGHMFPVGRRRTVMDELLKFWRAQ